MKQAHSDLGWLQSRRLAVVVCVACSLRCADVGPTAPPEETVDGVANSLASSDVSERVVPIRFVFPLSSPGQADFVSYDDMRKRVQETNWAFKGSGIQFYIAKWDRYVMPHFNSIDSTYWAWPSVRAELQLAFPSLASNAYSDSTILSEENWLSSAGSKAQDRTELVVFMPQSWSVCCYWANFPQVGSALALLFPGIGWKFTHELGHVFGLHHSHDAPPNTPNPISGIASALSDSWDLVYVPPSTTFTSRSGAAAYETQLLTKNVWSAGPPEYNNCRVDPTCTVTCTIEGTDFTTGSSMLKGLAFTFAGDAPGSPHRGFNAMSYITEAPSGACQCALDGNNGLGFSNSQAVQMRRFMRAEAIIDNPQTLVPSSLRLRSGRTQLGEQRARSPLPASLAERLDLDGDGKREIGIWQPPVNPQDRGTFKFLLSTLSYDPTLPLVRTFGRMGDVPVMADYNGDGRTDIAVYRRGGSTGSDPTNTYGWWDYCVSPAFDCSNTSPIQWGWQMDVPLPGTNFDGNVATGELAVYRPTDGNWYWRTVGSSTPHTINGYGGGSLGHVQLPGLYDSDEMTDIVYYMPDAGTFSMLLSSLNWAQASRIDRAFPGEVVPYKDGFYDSSGAVVMRRAQTKRWICDPICSYRPRRALQLWAERVGNWYTMWNPVSSSALSTCQWGASLDTPLSGFIDRDGDGMSDFAVWRLTESDSGGTFWFKDSSNGTCSGSYFGISPGQPPFGAPSPSAMVLPVWDMTADGKDEMMMIYPEALQFWWLTSTGYTTGYSQQFGTSGGLPL